MDNDDYVLSTILGAWVLSVGVLVTAAPAHDNAPDRPPVHSRVHRSLSRDPPGRPCGRARREPTCRKEESRTSRATRPIARAPGDQPRLSIPAGKQD